MTLSHAENAAQDAPAARHWHDVCASMNGPDYHDAAIRLIEAALGWVVDSDVIVAALKPATAA